MDPFDQVIRELKAEIERRYGGKRLELHINSVAKFARAVARTIADKSALVGKVYVAGLAHDLYKGWDSRSLREFILSERVPVDSDTWQMGRGLLHAPAAAHHLRTRLGVTDREIYEAVYYHTTGHPGAGQVEKILFCSDYLEPNRPQRPEESDAPELGRRMSRSLDEVYRIILGRKLAYTAGKGFPLHPNGVAAWNQVVLAARQKEKAQEKN